ncbi:DUF6776 family protein [Thalassotalea aquiviva]|uniref:DUF6776 family protein n=1 Tax=Thalassotalea aquiviva TaxID=3242415 RepID=UPI003529EABB
MNWLKKLSLAKLHQKFGAFKILLTSFTLLLLVGLGAYKLGNYFHKHQTELIEQQTARLDKLYQQNESALSRINTLTVELEIEKLANQKAQESLRKLEEQHFELKKQLAFYEKIMAPEKQLNGIIIDEVNIIPSVSENHYRIRVVLVQQEKTKSNVKGHVEVSFVGSLDNRPATIKLENVSPVTKDELSFSFQYFQVFETEFSLAQNFIPEQVSVSAVMPKGRWQKYQRLDQVYPWSEVVE